MATPVDHPVYKTLSKSYTIRSKYKIKRQELDLSGIGFPGKIAYVLHNVLSPEECEALIKETESVGYVPALIHSGNVAVLVPGYRDSQRIMIDDTKFAAILFQRIKHHLPQKFNSNPNSHGERIKDINERLRFLRYDVGDKFKAHFDGYYLRPDGSAQTYITLQLYLNQGMKGGETTFLKRGAKEADYEKEENRVPVTPTTGSILVFQHDILHEGSKVTGGTKYTVRMDVLYEYDDEIDSDTESQNKVLKSCIIG